VLPHPVFRREGDDLHTTVQVPLDVALLGGEVMVPTLKGSRVSLRVPPETQNGTRLRLRGLGMPRLRGQGHGDLYAEVQVRLPIPLTPEVRELAMKLRERAGAHGG
jgi:DnaJ-class molecular chaperone